MEFEKESLRDRPLENAWIPMLIRRFRPRTADALQSLNALNYSIRDVCAGRSPRAFAQQVFRHARAANIDSVFNQLTMAWSHLDVWLRCDVPEPTEDTTITQFLDQIESKAGIWTDMAQTVRSTRADPDTRYPDTRYPRYLQQRHNQQFTPPMYTQQQWQLSTQPQGYGQWNNRRQNFQPYWNYPNNAQPWNQNRQNWNWNNSWSNSPRQPQWQKGLNNNQNQGQGNQQNRNQQQQQLMIADKPWAQNTAEQGKQPWNQHPGQQATAYQAESCEPPDATLPLSSATPPDVPDQYGQYGLGQPEQPMPIEYTNDSVSYDADWELPPDPYYGAPVHNNVDGGGDTDDGSGPSVYAAHVEPHVSCLNCDVAFPSNNKLYAHLRNGNCHPNGRTKLIDADTGTYQIINSSRPDTDHSGYAFHNAHYLSTTVGLSKVEKRTTACLDSGCSMTLIDDTLARSLEVPFYDTQPINVNGLGSRVQCSTYIKLDVFMFGDLHGAASAGKLSIEAHVVPELRAKLLIGVDVMRPEGFTISFDKETVSIASCQGLTCPVTVHAKLNCIHECPVYARKATQIPPKTGAKLPVFTKKNLPGDQDLIFDPSPTFKHLTQYSHLVDANFSFIDVFNTTDHPVHISRRARMGSLSDGAYSAAYEVDVFAADTFTDERNMSHYQKDVTLTMGTTSTERILPNGVHIYSANKEHANAFESLVAQFPIWGELEGFVNVPEDDWMEIPLIPNWESQVP